MRRWAEKLGDIAIAQKKLLKRAQFDQKTKAWSETLTVRCKRGCTVAGCTGRMPKHGNLPVSGEKAPTLPSYVLQKCSDFPSASF